MNRGQRVAESLKDPNETDQAISECLLLFTISHNPGIDLARLREKLQKIWEKIQEKNPKFYFFWGKCNDGHNCQRRSLEDVLKLHAECGYIEAPNGFCYITYPGLKLLTDNMLKYDVRFSWAEIKECLKEEKKR